VTRGTADLVSLDEVRDAHRRIQPHVVRTPLVPLGAASPGSGLLLKAENLQPSGAFKLRGAFNTLLQMSDDEQRRGVVAHSSGNHAVAVAYAGAVLGISTVIVMPHDAPTSKLERTRTLGAEVVLVGSGSNERVAKADELVASKGYRLVEPYNSPLIIAATGTIAIETIEDHPDGSGGVAEIYVPVSGGGLAAGVAAAAKQLDPGVRVVGVEPEVAADAFASWQAGRIVELPAEQMARTAADGLRVQKVGSLTWPHLQAFVDEIVTVTEAEIRHAVRTVAVDARLVAEPSGATSVAAALEGRGGTGAPPQRRVAVLTGGNIDLSVLTEALTGQ
jgi:threo-3-hydroxy-L-aspartate ammonia-lyase